MTRLVPLSLKIGEYEAQVTTGLLQGRPVAKVVLVDSQELFLIPITRLDLDDAWLFTRKQMRYFTAIERTLLMRQSTSPGSRAQTVRNSSWPQEFTKSSGRGKHRGKFNWKKHSKHNGNLQAYYCFKHREPEHADNGTDTTATYGDAQAW